MAGGESGVGSPLALFFDILGEVLLVPAQSFSVNLSTGGGWLLDFQHSEMGGIKKDKRGT